MTIQDDHPNENEILQSKESKNYNLVFNLIPIILIFLLVALLFVFNFRCGISQGPHTQCQSNLKNIGTALEMYYTDYEGQFPDSLSLLVPEYLKEIPKCTKAKMDTYSSSYQVSHPYKLTFTLDGEKYYDYLFGAESYTFFCSGHNHAEVGVKPNYPQYNSREGLVPR